MGKIDEAREFLRIIGMPTKQQADLCCYALLAMCNISEEASWFAATNEWIRIHDILAFTKDHYGVEYAENSRETFRKQAMHQFRDAALSEDNGKPTNSPNYRYRITQEALDLIKCYQTDSWYTKLQEFHANHESLIELYASKKEMEKMPVNINGSEFSFSPGPHNELQRAIIEEFAPRFAPSSECLYVGDSTERDLFKNVKKLAELGFEITLHDKMPDVVLYREDKNWLYFIEAVCSVGPMDPERVMDIKQMTERVTSGKIYVTAFPDLKTFKKFSESLAWETEVWLSEMPDHMIHLNGDKFMGPRE
jgi:hypothetical protein